MQLTTQVIVTPDGINLFTRTYHPLEPVPGRTIYWVHGLGEHGGRYEHLVREMTGRGWTVIISDLRGHGRSTGVATHVHSFQEYVDDIRLVWDWMQLAAGQTVLLGHSMGGLVVIRAAQMGSVVPSRLVLSAPLLGVKVRINPLTILLGSLFVPLFPRLRLSNGIDPANMTHNAEFLAQRRGDPLINKTVTAGWFFAMRDALAQAWREAPRLSLPVFAIQGMSDKTTDPQALQDWWQRLGSTDKKLVMLDDHFHELFLEDDWRQTTGQMLDWLEQR